MAPDLAAALGLDDAVRKALVPFVAELRAVREAVDRLIEAQPPLLVGVQEAARRLGVSVSTVRRGVKDGSLPYRRIGRSVRIDLARCRGLDGAAVRRLGRSPIA
ncbi:excisionase family DNA-binding protein [Anaeromyxobacter oryzae]|uniref:Helix-turn-helix domain-containing protein n=1 Tax=Anaeromyxobacter oryzae TaxID=2918170 RepID=A0ABN6MYV8_9BACT|nr:helix-turn-helix domain-containing protein [Anaeromyxobacter oryzae]BDG04957.1 hypothetical protein AMOR_39530 [Anaeromyxobacter oryzae]